MCTADPNFIVRRMRPEEVELMRTWATAEGWNPGLHTGPCFFATDPAGFFVGELDGQPISCISCVAYDASFGFLGLYIVQPEFRGRGYGLQTWRTGMARLGSRNVGLDGVVAQQGNYKRSGFALAHDNIRRSARPWHGPGCSTCSRPLRPEVRLAQPFTDPRDSNAAPSPPKRRHWPLPADFLSRCQIRSGLGVLTTTRYEPSARKAAKTMKAYPNFQDLERRSGITWRDLAHLEPKLGELLWVARRACIVCRRWSDVDPAFSPIRNSLSELVGFAGKNHAHPILGSLGAYQVAYWKLYDAVAGLLPGRTAGAEETPEKDPEMTVPATCRREPAAPASARV